MKLFRQIILLLIFGIAFFCSTLQAQTTVCSGDSVVLVITTRTGGTTVWEQSPDDTTWSAASGNSYNDSLVIVAANTNYYRAIVTDGTCSPYYSDTVLVTVATLTPPVAKPASSITLISFNTNWSAVADAKVYYIDVATDSNFTIYVSGYQNKSVGNVTTYLINGVQCNTTYYYRVRDSSSICQKISGNSNTMSVSIGACPAECTYKSTCNGKITDSRDNKTYKTVQIGTQCWMAENLNIGKKIPGIQPQTQGINNQTTDIEKYCYGDLDVNCTKYGGLYLWDEMMAYGASKTLAPGPKGICPTGWHLPTDEEYTCLENTLGGATIAGGKLKDKDNWNSPNTGATNSSGFSALAAGARVDVGSFSSQGYNADLWSATEIGATTAWNRYLNYNDAQVGSYSYTKVFYGFSVRCVKD